jgi:hypothetical protein
MAHSEQRNMGKGVFVQLGSTNQKYAAMVDIEDRLRLDCD